MNIPTLIKRALVAVNILEEKHADFFLWALGQQPLPSLTYKEMFALWNARHGNKLWLNSDIPSNGAELQKLFMQMGEIYIASVFQSKILPDPQRGNK